MVLKPEEEGSLKAVLAVGEPGIIKEVGGGGLLAKHMALFSEVPVLTYGCEGLDIGDLGPFL